MQVATGMLQENYNCYYLFTDFACFIVDLLHPAITLTKMRNCNQECLYPQKGHLMRSTGLIALLLACVSLFGLGRAQADFLVSLEVTGNGSIRNDKTGLLYGHGQSFTMTGTSGTITAIPVGLTIGSVADQSINFGDDLVLNISTTLGSKFKKWENISPIEIPAPDESNPTLLLSGSLGSATARAVFSSSVADVGINSAKLSLDNGATWFNASSFSYSSGNTLATFSWSDLVANGAVVGANPNVLVQLGDLVNNTDDSGFDLDVFTPSSVPEPTGFILAGLVAGLYARFRRFGKRGSNDSDVVG